MSFKEQHQEQSHNHEWVIEKVWCSSSQRTLLYAIKDKQIWEAEYLQVEYSTS